MNAGCNICLVTIDGTAFCIEEPTPFSHRRYSHKVNGPGLRYEIGICIHTGWIMWICGPFPPGDWPDLNIAWHRMTYLLDYGEKYIADWGYCDRYGYAETPNCHRSSADQQIKQMVRACHDMVNGLFKKYAVLREQYWHDIDKHGCIFKAIANLVQAKIMLDGPMFHVVTMIGLVGIVFSYTLCNFIGLSYLLCIAISVKATVRSIDRLSCDAV